MHFCLSVAHLVPTVLLNNRYRLNIFHKKADKLLYKAGPNFFAAFHKAFENNDHIKKIFFPFSLVFASSPPLPLFLGDSLCSEPFFYCYMLCNTKCEVDAVVKNTVKNS